MSLAGPAANLTLALLAIVTMRLLVAGDVLVAPDVGIPLVTTAENQALHTPLGALARALTVLAVLNVILGLFNLVPLPPLDGASVLEGVAPRATAGMYQRLREIPAFDFLGLMIAWRFFPYVSEPALRLASSLLHA